MILESISNFCDQKQCIDVISGVGGCKAEVKIWSEAVHRPMITSCQRVMLKPPDVNIFEFDTIYNPHMLKLREI